MFCCGGKRNSTERVLARGIESDKKFKRVEETYRLYAFLMALGMMYPNPRTDKIRLVVLSIVFLLGVSALVLIVNDICIRARDGDMANLVRQMTVLISISFSVTKPFLTIIYKKDLQEIFHSISADYISYNDLPEDYHDVVEQSIKQSKLIESAWPLMMLSACIMFPGSAIVLNIYSFLFSDTPRRFMVHESHIWGMTSEMKYSSPFYEIYFVYCLCILIIIFISFVAFDGMFSICIFHVSLKLKIASIKLKHVLDDKSDLAKIKSNIAEVVRCQYEVYNFISKLMNCYKEWLVLMFTFSVIEIGMTLSQIPNNRGSDSGANIVYLFFVTTNIAHIFFPCYICSDVTHTATLFTDAIYSIPWEDVPDTDFRRSVCFMIARSQIPLNIDVLNLLTFNMEMFVSVLQTAYSMFTLLRQ